MTVSYSIDLLHFEIRYSVTKIIQAIEYSTLTAPTPSVFSTKEIKLHAFEFFIFKLLTP